LVEELLVPVDDEKNEHKQKQLRELVSDSIILDYLRNDSILFFVGFD
jgi:hypothetical protein